MARRVLTVTIRVTGMRELIRATSKWPEDAQKEIQDASARIAGVVAERIRAAASTNAQSALIAPSVRVMKSNAPIIQAGGSGRVGRNRVPAYKVLFGSEFGSNALSQFRAFNASGYWFFVTVDASADYIGQKYSAAIQIANIKWGL